MNNLHLRRRGFAALSLLGLAGASTVWAQEPRWPSRPVRLVVPYAAGGPTDIIARLVAQYAGAALGQSIVVDNRAGAGGTIGVTAVLKSDPDGYTLALVAPGPIAGMPHLMKLPYGAADVQYVTTVARTSSVLVVRAGSGIDSLADLLREAKRRPGKLNYGSAGPGTTPHLGAELLKQEAGIDIVHVPYKGAAPALTALMAGEIQLMLVDLLPTLPHLASGRLRALAVVGAARNAQIPQVPTTGELGLPRVTMDTDYGIVGPRGLPETVQQRVRDAVAAALQSPQVKAELARLGAVGFTSTSDEYRARNEEESRKWQRVVSSGHITLE